MVQGVEKVGNVHIHYVKERKLDYDLSTVIDYMERGLKVLYVNGVDKKRDIINGLLNYISCYKENMKVKMLGYVLVEGSLKICRGMNHLVSMDKCTLIHYDIVIVDGNSVTNDNHFDIIKEISRYLPVIMTKQ